MNNILTAIYGMYSGNATLKAAIPGGLHLELAPQAATLPHGVYTAITARPDYYFGGRRFEILTVQFDIYADTNAKRMTAYNALIGLYDDARPTVTGYTSIIIERQGQQFLRDGAQNEIFRAIVNYQCTFLKS